MFVVTVTFDIRPQAWETFLPLMKTNAQASLDEDECYQFDVCIDQEKKRVFLYEVYATQAAFDFHLTTAHFLEFNQQTQEMIESKDIQIYHKVL
ncbi:putative quinol monooxygenase [Vibrio sp. CK2-1]|uniref:putative quinol monooxygenase n=1 Tax=Vibrio sp. CK2-1 TaxID=2912249 RepID=UPI001F209B38|nr:putative quinol monooxygenase [Vibrio sp. CK2-1]MCF7353164.1 antibiotic biosynthesis monooxygenase [Vibrio sp. CK2-1]